MTPSEEFRSQASYCKRMAREAHYKTTKSTWLQIAQGWNACVEMVEREEHHDAESDVKATKPAARPRWPH